MRLNYLSFTGLLGLLAAACASPANPETDDVVSSESDLAAAGIGEACSAPVRSADGAYVAVDLCPSGGAAGQVLRVDLATNATTVVATYPATDRIENLSERGGAFVFDVLREVDAAGDATRGIEVHVHDWALAAGRTIATAPIEGVAGDFHRLAVLGLTEDGTNVFYAASAPTAQSPDAELARRLMVAPATGTAAPAAVDLGDAVIPNDMRFSTSGDSIVGHALSLDANNAVGEKLYLVESRGASGPRLVGKPRASFVSPALADAKPGKPSKPGKAWDGTRAWGLRANANETNDLVAFEPRNETEKVLESGLGLRIITSVGSDVIYTTRADVATGSEVTLKKIPAAGGTPVVLAQTTVPTRDHATVAFDLITVGTSGTYAVFRTVAPSATPSAFAPFERWLVKLDGSVPAEKLSGTGMTFMPDLSLGDRSMFFEQHSGGQVGRRSIDLRAGTVTSAGIALGYAQTVLVGDGSFLEIQSCTGSTFTDSWRQITHVTPNGSTTSPCGRNNWSNIPLALPGSPYVVFYAETGLATARRYQVAVVRP